MLDNTKRGFIEEMIIVVVVTAILVSLAIYYNDIVHHYPKHSVVQDAIIGIFLIFFLSFFSVRVVRLSIVYRSHVWLNMFHLPLIGLLLATGASMYNDPNLGNIIFFVVMIGLDSFYYLCLSLVTITDSKFTALKFLQRDTPFFEQ